MRINWYGATVAIIVGCLVNYIGDWLFGIRIELFWGLQTFNFIWFLQLFIWPIVVGISVSLIYGLGGKWFAVLPPLIMRFIAYFETVYILGVPPGADLMPMGWWGFFVILAMETAMIGGVAGEIMNKKVYGWDKVKHVRDLKEGDEGYIAKDGSRSVDSITENVMDAQSNGAKNDANTPSSSRKVNTED